MKNQWRDLSLRFILGGSAVAFSYVLLYLIPWKTFAGVFAAFPAVLAAAVIMAGSTEGSTKAAEVALGAVAGMLGCALCVLAAIIFIDLFHSLLLAISLSLVVWFFSSLLFFYLNGKVLMLLKRRKVRETATEE